MDCLTLLLFAPFDGFEWSGLRAHTSAEALEWGGGRWENAKGCHFFLFKGYIVWSCYAVFLSFSMCFDDFVSLFWPYVELPRVGFEEPELPGLVLWRFWLEKCCFDGFEGGFLSGLKLCESVPFDFGNFWVICSMF